METKEPEAYTKEVEKKDLATKLRDTKKLIFIENFEESFRTKKKRQAFAKFYWNNLEMNYLEALEVFKKIKPIK